MYVVCCIIHIYCIKNTRVTRVRFQIHLKYGKMSWPSCGLRYIPNEAHRWLHTDGPLRQLWQPLIHFQSGYLKRIINFKNFLLHTKIQGFVHYFQRTWPDSLNPYNSQILRSILTKFRGYSPRSKLTWLVYYKMLNIHKFAKFHIFTFEYLWIYKNFYSW